MRTIVAAALLLLTSSSATAAVKYTFRQSTRTDFQSIPRSETVGHAIIDGDRSRVDFPGKSFYGEDAYVISKDGSKHLTVVDPTKKTIAEIDVTAVAAALGSSRLTISNLKTDLQKLPDQISIAGVPTEHYRLDMSYDVSLMVGQIELKQNVHTVIERWTTDAFGPVSDIFLAAGLPRTGNPQLDAIIDAEATKTKGLPLKQLVTITTTMPIDRRKKPQTKSELQVNPTRRQMSEMLVSDVKVISADPSIFDVPTTYRRLDGTSLTPSTAVHEVSMEPATP